MKCYVVSALERVFVISLCQSYDCQTTPVRQEEMTIFCQFIFLKI